jgi:hypothetical protein
MEIIRKINLKESEVETEFVGDYCIRTSFKKPINIKANEKVEVTYPIIMPELPEGDK